MSSDELVGRDPATRTVPPRRYAYVGLGSSGTTDDINEARRWLAFAGGDGDIYIRLDLIEQELAEVRKENSILIRDRRALHSRVIHLEGVIANALL